MSETLVCGHCLICVGGYVLTCHTNLRAALSAAEKREARLRRELVDLASVVRSGVTALHAIAKAESNPGKQRALEILARGLSLLAEVSAENGGTEASAASAAPAAPKALSESRPPDPPETA